MALAVAQQFNNRAGRSPAGDDCLAGWLNSGNIEDGRELIAGLGRLRSGK